MELNEENTKSEYIPYKFKDLKTYSSTDMRLGTYILNFHFGIKILKQKTGMPPSHCSVFNGTNSRKKKFAICILNEEFM